MTTTKVSKITPAVEPKPAPSPAFDPYDLGRIAERMMETTAHVRDLGELLYEIQDGGHNFADTLGPISFLLTTFADDLDDMAGYFNAISTKVQKAEPVAVKGGDE